MTPMTFETARKLFLERCYERRPHVPGGPLGQVAAGVAGGPRPSATGGDVLAVDEALPLREMFRRMR